MLVLRVASSFLFLITGAQGSVSDALLQGTASDVRTQVLGSMYSLDPAVAQVLSKALERFAESEELEVQSSHGHWHLDLHVYKDDKMSGEKEGHPLIEPTLRRLSESSAKEIGVVVPPMAHLPVLVNANLSPLIWLVIILGIITVIVLIIGSIDPLFKAPPKIGQLLSSKEARYHFLTDGTFNTCSLYYSLMMNSIILFSLVTMVVSSDHAIKTAWAGVFNFSEWIFLFVFTAEWIATLLCCPSQRDYLTSSLTYVDIAAVAPSYFELLLSGAGGLSGMRLFRLARMFRLFRLVKLVKNNENIEMVLYGLHACVPSFGMVFATLGCTMFVPSVLMHYVEMGDWDDRAGCFRREGEDVCSPFESIIVSMYWGITTVTTVGYGDVCPKSGLGKFLAGPTMVCGIIALALPIGMISSAFNSAVDEWKEKYNAGERARLLERGKGDETASPRG